MVFKLSNYILLYDFRFLISNLHVFYNIELDTVFQVKQLFDYVLGALSFINPFSHELALILTLISWFKLDQLFIIRFRSIHQFVMSYPFRSLLGTNKSRGMKLSAMEIIIQAFFQFGLNGINAIPLFIHFDWKYIYLACIQHQQKFNIDSTFITSNGSKDFWIHDYV